MKKQTKNPFNNFLFSVPGKHDKMTYDELKLKKNKIKEVEVIDIRARKSIGRMSVYNALLKFL